MALNAAHIRARALSPDPPSARPSIESRRRSASPPSTYSIRAGIGSSSSCLRNAPDDSTEWYALRTGESLAAKALRMRHRFVKATYLSDPSLAASQSASVEQAVPPHIFQTPNEDVEAAKPTLAQLYSELAQDMAIPPSERSHTGSASSTARGHASPSHHDALDQKIHRAHRHGHPSQLRHETDWFISKAFDRLRQPQHATASSARTARIVAVEQPVASSSGTRRCLRCGDVFPQDVTPEYMTRHRQSIGHRLGLNAPVSSTSASEAPSQAPSEAVTPAARSRSSSQEPHALLETPMQDTPRRLTRIPRRLSNAPRWKKIAGDNVGHSLLSRMGWKEGMGLGVQEWKWQQLRREKEKRLRSAAVRSLLLRQGSGDQQRGSELQPSMPFALELRDREEQRIAAEAWLSGLVGPEAEWIQTMMLNERQLLQQALISGQVTIKDLQEALSIDADGFSPALFGSLQPNEAMPIDEALTEAQDDDALQSDALLYPVEVELRSDRRGIGVKRSSTDALSGAHQRRRSRAAEGSVEIRRQSPGSNETLAKRIRPTSAGRPFRSPTRSRSRSGAGASGRSETQAELTRRQREQAYQRDKRDWLDLRASLS